MLKRLTYEVDGQTILEYGLLVGLLSVAAIAILSLMGTKVRNVFNTINSSIISTTDGGSGGPAAPPPPPPPPPPGP